ncbi:MAG TPA: CvpA family protein [Dysgonamonadaceae bacterium]|nr:CvpA family protein [Dysgonamonadaceae bacterium]
MLNWFDIIIAIALITAFASGFRQGLIRQLINLCGLILGVVFAGQTAKIILPWLLQITHIPHNIASVVSYLMAFAIIMAIIALLGSIIQKFIAIIHLGFFNKLLGSMVSIGTATVVLSLILNVVLMLDPKEKIIKKETKEDSFFFERIQIVIPAIVPYLNKEVWKQYIPEQQKETIQTFSPTLQNNLNQIFISNSYRRQLC